MGSIPGQETNVVIYLKMPRREVMHCNKAYIAHLLEEKREGAERVAETSPWGQEWKKRKIERERKRQEVGKARLLKGNIANMHRVCSQWL